MFQPLEDVNPDDKPVTTEELKGWYSYAVASEGYAALGSAVFFPIVLQQMAATNGVMHNNHSMPCNVTGVGYKCDVNIAGIYVDTSSAVFFASSISVLIQFILFITLGASADRGGY